MLRAPQKKPLEIAWEYIEEYRAIKEQKARGLDCGPLYEAVTQKVCAQLDTLERTSPKQYRAVQYLYLREHAGKWLPELGDRVVADIEKETNPGIKDDLRRKLLATNCEEVVRRFADWHDWANDCIPEMRVDRIRAVFASRCTSAISAVLPLLPAWVKSDPEAGEKILFSHHPDAIRCVDWQKWIAMARTPEEAKLQFKQLMSSNCSAVFESGSFRAFLMDVFFKQYPAIENMARNALRLKRHAYPSLIHFRADLLNRKRSEPAPQPMPLSSEETVVEAELKRVRVGPAPEVPSIAPVPGAVPMATAGMEGTEFRVAALGWDDAEGAVLANTDSLQAYSS